MQERSGTIDRRSVLGLGAAGVLAGLAPAAPARAQWRGERTRRATNVIFVVVDGMSFGTFGLAEMMRDVRGMGPSHWSRLWARPGVRRAVCTTHAADGWVTDSAAAGSAWGIGEHINNGAINFTPDGRTPEPIFASARALGKATGLVTTTRLTHATPASFIANVPKRAMEDEIARQMLDRGFDLALGGGEKHFGGGLLSGHPELNVVRTAQQLDDARGSSAPMLGLFKSDHMSYALDRESNEPTLKAMTSTALDRLGRSPDGFVLQIEGGRVDHAAHDNDAASLIADQIEFDQALGAVVEWCEGRDDTLVIVTTDHGNANPGLTYYGQRGVESFEKLAGATHSFQWVKAETARNGGGFEALIEAAHRASGVELTTDEIAILRRRLVEEAPVDPFDLANSAEAVLGSVLANHFGVAFLSPNHTADMVEVTAFGPGSESMPVLIDNIDLHHMAMNALSHA